MSTPPESMFFGRTSRCTPHPTTRRATDGRSLSPKNPTAFTARTSPVLQGVRWRLEHVDSDRKALEQALQQSQATLRAEA
eukprot:CAMPEP_0194514638 /NCGR_PEP_ID=MMETSP0253-20130528/47136_1 /TAXON_ID=2966 /ORGANISM="Noctiluca scintillans" /LENGTH=79 /DNA_ID=CAMNT_0039358323 /DNA_START=63 /DNA_END=299 /DNA_ORIENTATION=-